MAIKAKQIVDEIVSKVTDFENNMGAWLNNVGEWGDLFRIKRPSRKENTFSNPRLTEFFRAGNTLGTMMYRMQTSAEELFDVVPMSPLRGSDQLLKIRAVLETQMEAAQYKRNLLKADMGVACFGTQIIENRRTVIGVNRFGRRVPITTFTPRSLLQFGFDRSCSNLDDADWVFTTDLISDSGLMALASNSELLKQNWNKKVLEFAADEEVKTESMSAFVQKRLRMSGYITTDDKMARKIVRMYHGKLDVIGDGVEYSCGLVNDTHLALFEANKNQHGKRNFRIGYWVEDPLLCDPMGLGLGGLLGDLHKSMDGNRQRVQDNITMSVYNMYERLRTAGIDDNDLKIRPLNLVDTDERGGLTPIPVNLGGAEAGLKLEDILKNEFMNASGATPTLQAQITSATASEVTIAQNEAVRNVSCKAELLAEPFMREYLYILHSDNVQYLKAPINVNRSGIAGAVYPADLKCDVDFKLKLVTDASFKPQRLEKLLQALQLITSTKSQNPEMANYPVKPIINEILRILNIPADEMERAGQLQMISQALGMQQMDPMQAMMPQRGGGGGASPTTFGGVPTPPGPQVESNDAGMIQTPVGPVLGSMNQ